MCKGLGIMLAVLCLFCAPASLFAQNTIFDLNYQSSLFLKRAAFFQHEALNLPALAATPLDLTAKPPAIEYQALTVPLNRPIYSLIKNKGLIHEYWQDLKSRKTGTTAAGSKNIKVDRNLFNSLYNKPKVDEKKLIRQAWKKVFGLDVWYPYYKAKEIEHWVKERMSVRFFGFKGKPKFENDQILYIFKATF